MNHKSTQSRSIEQANKSYKNSTNQCQIPSNITIKFDIFSTQHLAQNQILFTPTNMACGYWKQFQALFIIPITMLLGVKPWQACICWISPNSSTYSSPFFSNLERSHLLFTDAAISEIAILSKLNWANVCDLNCSKNSITTFFHTCLSDRILQAFSVCLLEFTTLDMGALYSENDKTKTRSYWKSLFPAIN